MSLEEAVAVLLKPASLSSPKSTAVSLKIALPTHSFTHAFIHSTNIYFAPFINTEDTAVSKTISPLTEVVTSL